MLKELMYIYKIDLDGLPANRLLPSVCACTSVATIAGLHLPDHRSLTGKYCFISHFSLTLGRSD